MEIDDDVKSRCSQQTEPFEPMSRNEVIGSEVNWEKRIEYVSKWLKQSERFSSAKTMGQHKSLPLDEGVIEISDDDSVESESITNLSVKNLVKGPQYSEVQKSVKRRRRKKKYYKNKYVKKVKIENERMFHSEIFPAINEQIQEQPLSVQTTTQHLPFTPSSSQPILGVDEPVEAKPCSLDVLTQTEEIKAEMPVVVSSSVQTQPPALEETSTQTLPPFTFNSSVQTTNPVLSEMSMQTSPPYCFNSFVQTDSIITRAQTTQTKKYLSKTVACQTDPLSNSGKPPTSPLKSPERKMNSRERNKMARAINLVNSQKIKDFMMLSTMYQSSLDQIGMTQYLLKRNGDSIWSNVQETLLGIQKTMMEKAVVHLSNVKPAFMQLNAEEREFFKKILMEVALDWVQKTNTPVKVNLDMNPFSWMIELLNNVMSESNVESEVCVERKISLKEDSEGVIDQCTTVVPADHSPAYGDLPPESNTFGQPMTVIPMNSSPLVATMKDPSSNDAQDHIATPANAVETSSQNRVFPSVIIETSLSSQASELQVSRPQVNVNGDTQLEHRGTFCPSQIRNQCEQNSPQGQPATVDQSSAQPAHPNDATISAVTCSILTEYAQSVPAMLSPILSPNIPKVTQSNHPATLPRLPISNSLQSLPINTPQIPNQYQTLQQNSLQRQAISNAQQQVMQAPHHNDRPQVSVPPLWEQHHQQLMQQSYSRQAVFEGQLLNLTQHSIDMPLGGPCTSMGPIAPGQPSLQSIQPLQIINNPIPVPLWRHQGPQMAHQNLGNSRNFVPVPIAPTSYSQTPPGTNASQNQIQPQYGWNTGYQPNSAPWNRPPQPNVHFLPVQQIQQGGIMGQPVRLHLQQSVPTSPRQVRQRRASTSAGEGSPVQRKARLPERRMSVCHLPQMNQPQFNQALETWNIQQHPSAESSMQINASSMRNTQPQQQQSSSVLQTNHQMQSPSTYQVPPKQKHHRESTETSFLSSQHCPTSPLEIPQSQSQPTVKLVSSLPDLSQCMSKELSDLQRGIQNFPGIEGSSTSQSSSKIACTQVTCLTVPTQDTSESTSNHTANHQIRLTPLSNLMPPPSVPASRVRRGRQMSTDSCHHPKKQTDAATVNYSQCAGILQGTSGQTAPRVKCSSDRVQIEKVVNLPHVQSQLWAHFMGSFYQSRKNLQKPPQVEQQTKIIVEEQQQVSKGNMEQDLSQELPISQELLTKLKRTMKICTICVTNNTNMVCSKCLSAAYCSSDCKEQDFDHSCQSSQFIFL